MLSSRGHRPNFWSSGGLRTTRKSAMKKTQHVHWRPRPSFHQEKQGGVSNGRVASFSSPISAWFLSHPRTRSLVCARDSRAFLTVANSSTKCNVGSATGRKDAKTVRQPRPSRTAEAIRYALWLYYRRAL